MVTRPALCDARRMRHVLTLGVLLLLGCNRKTGLDPSFEGTITMHTTYADRPAQEMTLSIKAGKVRFDTTGDGGKPLHGLYDPQKNVVTIYLDEAKAFTELDLAGGSAAPNTIPEASVAEKTGKTQTIAGVTCDEWVAKEPGGRRSEVCVVEGVNFFDLSRVRAGAAADLGSAAMQNKKMFALRSVEFDAKGKELSRTEVTRVERGSVDDARLSPPAGYTKVEPPKAP